MQSLMNRVRQHLKWLQQKYWMLLQDYWVVTEKQLTPCQDTLRQSWRMLPDCSEFQSQGVQIFWTRLPRHTMAKIMVKHWRSSGTFWTKCVRTPTCCPLMGKTVRGSSNGTWMGKSTELGMSVCSSKTRILLFLYSWMISKWLERSRTCFPCGRNSWKLLILEKRHHFLTTYTWGVPNVNANQKKPIVEQYKKMFESRISVGTTDFERYCELANQKTAVVQSFNLLLGWSQHRGGGVRNSRRRIQSMLINCLEMLVLGTNW